MDQSGTWLYWAILIEVLPLSKKNNKTYHVGSIPQKMQKDLAYEISSKSEPTLIFGNFPF